MSYKKYLMFSGQTIKKFTNYGVCIMNLKEFKSKTESIIRDKPIIKFLVRCIGYNVVRILVDMCCRNTLNIKNKLAFDEKYMTVIDDEILKMLNDKLYVSSRNGYDCVHNISVLTHVIYQMFDNTTVKYINGETNNHWYVEHVIEHGIKNNEKYKYTNSIYGTMAVRVPLNMFHDIVVLTKSRLCIKCVLLNKDNTHAGVLVKSSTNCDFFGYNFIKIFNVLYENDVLNKKIKLLEDVKFKDNLI